MSVNTNVKLNPQQKLAYKYSKAHSALCSHFEEAKDYSPEELSELRRIRGILHKYYVYHDPDCTFDTSLEYEL